MVPTSCPDVPTDVLWPRDTWSNKEEYDKLANKLVEMFNSNFEQYLDGVDEAIKLVTPKLVN